MEQTSNFYQKFLFFQVIIIISIHEMAIAQKTPLTIKVGVVLDMDHYIGQMGLECITMGLSEFYAKHEYYNTRLHLINRHSKSDVIGAASAAIDLLKNVKVQAIIGPQYSSEANFIIALGKKAQVPIITFTATSPSLSSFRSQYFVRATLNDSSQVEAIAAIVQAYGWQEVVLIYEDNTFGGGIVPFLTDALEDVNARVPYRSVLPSQATGDQIVAELYKLKSMHTRVFVVHLFEPLGSHLFTKVKQLGMMSEDYVWIITDGMTYELNSVDPLVLKSMLGVVGVRPYTPKTIESENFKIRYKRRVQQNNPKVLSPDLNIFGLWAYDATVSLAAAVEKASLRSNLTFLEANITRNSSDLESLGMSLAGPNLIQALLSMSFKGLAGTFNLIDGQLQSPPYEIINVVGSGDRVIGYWTKQNGITKELNSTRIKTTMYSINKSNFGSIIWPGDKTSPAKGWVIPINENKLRVGVPVKDGFSEFVKVTWNSDNSITVGGLCIEIFDEVMKLLPYGVPYEYIPFATPDHKMAGKYDDLVEQVYLGNFDAVAGDVTILANRSQLVDFTLPYMESGVSMVVPFMPDKRKSVFMFFKPLSTGVWLMSFGSCVVVGILVWIMERNTNDDFIGTRWYEFGMVFWFAFSTVVFAHRERIVTNPAKLLLIGWFFVILILTQSYGANFASMLTVQRLRPTITDVNHLIKNNLRVGYKNGSFVYEFLTRKLAFHEERVVKFNSPEEMDELLQKGSENGGIAAAFHEIPYIKLFLAKYCSKYTMVGPVYRADGLGFVFPIGSPLVPDVSRAILNFTDGKTMKEVENNWLRNDKCPDSGTLKNEDDSNSLEFASFSYPFMFMGAIAFLAVAGYLMEKRHSIHYVKKQLSIDTTTDTDSEKLSKLLKLVQDMNDRELNKGLLSQELTPTSSTGSTHPEQPPHDTNIQNTQADQPESSTTRDTPFVLKRDNGSELQGQQLSFRRRNT